jgi:hypothetical protein
MSGDEQHFYTLLEETMDMAKEAEEEIKSVRESDWSEKTEGGKEEDSA